MIEKKKKYLMISSFLVLLVILAFIVYSWYEETPTVDVSLTFDDGYASQYNTLKYLESRGIRATVYVTNLSYFEGMKMMTREQIEDLSKFHEIGWHTRSHANATDADESEFIPGYNATSFSYPYGRIGNQDIVKKYFKSARGISWGLNEKVDCNMLEAVTVNSNNFDAAMLYTSIYSSITKRGWVIFAIHEVKDNPRQDIDITPEQFQRLLERIEAKRWRVISLNKCA